MLTTYCDSLSIRKTKSDLMSSANYSLMIFFFHFHFPQCQCEYYVDPLIELICYYCAACSLILLPSRVVQALNLNVHALGLPVSPKEGFFFSFFFFFFWGCFLVMFDLSLKENYFSDDKTKGRDCNSNINKNDKDVQAQCCASVISQNQSSSPEIFLPKEWTY